MNPLQPQVNPFVGPEPFGPHNSQFFFGRESEASELLSLIVAHQVFVLYAQSGAGKTSLVKARLIPSLEEKGFEVLGPVRVQGLSVPENFAEDQNIFVLNALNYLKHNHTDLKEQRTDLRSRLRRDLTTDTDEDLSPRIIIFDQFEELFTFYGERWQDRKQFFEQVAAIVSEDPLVRILFVMREDYVAELAQYEHLLPGRLQMRLRLERLRESAAATAIREPLIKMGRHKDFAAEVAHQVTAELLKIHVQTEPGVSLEREGEFVEAVQLQVVCQKMWESRWANVPPDQKQVADEQRVSLADIDWALTLFYEERVRAVVQKTGPSEEELRRWFQEKLITPAKTRGMVFAGKDDAAGLPNAAVRALENLHLIRGDNRAGARWYELTHDRFIEPIHESNRAWSVRFETVRQLTARVIAARLVAAVLFLFLILLWLGVIERLPQKSKVSQAQLDWIKQNSKTIESKLNKENEFLNAHKQIRTSYDRVLDNLQKEVDETRKLANLQKEVDEKGKNDKAAMIEGLMSKWPPIIESFNSKWPAIIKDFKSKWPNQPVKKDEEPIRRHDARLLRQSGRDLERTLRTALADNKNSVTGSRRVPAAMPSNLATPIKDSERQIPPAKRAAVLKEQTSENSPLEDSGPQAQTSAHRDRREWFEKKKTELDSQAKSNRILGIDFPVVYGWLPIIWCLLLLALVVYLAYSRRKLKMDYNRVLMDSQTKGSTTELKGRVSSNYSSGQISNQTQKSNPLEYQIITDPFGWSLAQPVAPALTILCLSVLLLIQFRVTILSIELTSQLRGSKTFAAVISLTLITTVLLVSLWIALPWLRQITTTQRTRSEKQ